MDFETRLARAKTKLITVTPFFGSLVLNLRIHITDQVPSMGTNGKDLYINREWTESLDDKQIMGVLAHEAMHCAWKHTLRMGNRDPKLANLAMDVAINDLLLAQTNADNQRAFSLPEGGVWSESMGLGPEFRNKNWEWIYDNLPEEVKEKMASDVEEHLMPGDNMSEDQLKEAEAEADRMIKVAAETAKAQGKLPAGIKDYVDGLLEPKICWKEKLRRHVIGDNPEDFSYRRPNRRALGRGLYMPSVHRLGVGVVAVVLDTSGSVSKRELTAFVSECQAIMDETNPQRLIIINADTDIHKVDEFESPEDLRGFSIEGRGGTDMFPAFRYIEEHHMDELQAVICMSDMEFHWPAPNDWPEFDVLWVSSGATKHEFGDLVKIEV